MKSVSYALSVFVCAFIGVVLGCSENVSNTFNNSGRPGDRVLALFIHSSKYMQLHIETKSNKNYSIRTLSGMGHNLLYSVDIMIDGKEGFVKWMMNGDIIEYRKGTVVKAIESHENQRFFASDDFYNAADVTLS